jgi:diguanylate cyclase (GGDEF)-like protein/PAS domain S-box-containing protein
MTATATQSRQAAPIARRPGIVLLLLAALLGYGALYASWLLLGWGGADQQLAIADAIYLPLGGLVVLIAVLAARRAQDRRVRRAWSLFALSFAAYAFGDLAWFWIEIVQGQEVPAPSIADLGYLAFYPLLMLGLLALPRQDRSDRSHLLDLAIVCTAGAAAIWWLVVGPVASATGSDLAASFVAVAYPVGDLIVLFALAAAILGRVRGVPASVLVLLGVGIVCNAIADLAYARLSLEATSESGAWLDVAYMTGWLALGLAGIVQLRAPADTGAQGQDRLHRPVSALPYVATAGILAIVALASAGASFDTRVLVAGAIIVTALVSVRQLLTTRQNAELLRRELHSEARYAEILRTASDAIVVVDRDGRITYATPSAASLLGGSVAGSDASAGGLVGQPASALIQPADAPLLVELLRTTVDRPDQVRSVACRAAASPDRELEAETANLLGNPLVGGIVLTLRDVTERRRFESELRSLALHDPLTGLANRVLFGDRLEQALHRSQRRRTRPSVLYLDLDSFKTVNDTLGHTAGDEVLVEVARRLRLIVRDEDTAARLGGDEFGVLIEDTRDEAEAVRVAERIAQALAAPFEIGGNLLTVAASVGIVRSGSRSDDKVTLLRDADIAMYEAKRETPGAHQVFTNQMYEHTVDRVRMEADLRVALDAAQLEVVYQSLVDLASDRVVGVEALLRWHHPERGSIEPAVFIPLAESSGQIERIGLWVLEEACRTVGGWNASSGAPPLRANVNVSVRQLTPTFAEAVADVLHRTGFPPHLLVLELTESVFAVESQQLVTILHALRDRGVRISIDDFGTGYSSLGYLRDLPVDELKIDQSFIATMGTRGEQGLVATIIQMGRDLSLDTVAEGIESPEQLEMLRRLGCDLGQGYLLGRPSSVGSDGSVGGARMTGVSSPAA